VFGCAGPRLSDEERRFFAATDPLGFILFARNCIEPAQIRALTAELRSSINRPEAPVLIDQEGGRIQRLGPPHWRAAPAAAVFGALAQRDLAAAREAVQLNAQLLAAELVDLGIDVDCAPVLDVPVAGAHGIIGDRAYANDSALVGDLGREACAGFLSAGVAPMIKHVPGHGRARADSHLELPTVDTDLETLTATDFVPFKANAHAPYAMTAHVVFTAIDAAQPVTLSSKAIENVIRRKIGFDGFLFSDDVGMHALSGPLDARAAAALAAGCDAVLHCSGDLVEMRAIAPRVPPLTVVASARLARARALISKPQSFDLARAADRLQALIARAA
jgi:beta-N-acetylhexosaminidase